MTERTPGAGPGPPARARLRSDAWFTGDDEVAMAHRVAFTSAGLEVSRRGGRPVIGIANSASELNPCNLPLRDLAGAVRRGVVEAGGIPAEFGSISLGEDLMKPTAMLYRNLLAVEIEEMIRAYPLDGIVILANCDKTVPGAIMGAASADIPTVVVTGGARPAAVFRGERIGTGTALWRLWDERRTGRLGDDGWQALEACLACGTGACNTMGTASTVALLAETLGLMIPGSSTIPAGDPRAPAAAAEAGRRAVAAVTGGLVPSALLSPAAFGNAIRVLHAVGGSTNAVIHLAAISGEAAWERIAEVNIEGTYVAFEAARRAGVPRVIYASSNHAVGFAPRASFPVPDYAFPEPDTYYGVSNHKWRFWDISDAKRDLGYEPQDNAEVWRGKIEV